MNLNELEQVYLHRQSCRSFDASKDVSEEQIEKICRVATLAPSACNSQPYKIIALKGESKQAVEPCIQSMGMNKFASDAPVLLALCQGESKLTAKVLSLFQPHDFMQTDIGILAAHIVLAAEAEGLSTCILGWRNEDKLGKALSLPKGKQVPLVIALGYAQADYPIREKKRKPFENVYELRN